MSDNVFLKHNVLRVAYLVSHPIQYQVQFLRELSNDSMINLKVFYCSDISVGTFFERGFGKIIDWNMSLLDGYDHEFLPCIGDSKKLSLWRPLNYGLFNKLRDGEYDAIIIHGYMRLTNIIAIFISAMLGIKIYIRDESTLVSKKRGIIKRAFKKVFFIIIDRLVTGWLSIGTLNREYYIAHSISKDKIFSVPYAVDNVYFQSRCADASLNREEFKRELKLDKNIPVILFASKLQTRKNALDLLHAYYRMSPDGKTEPDAYLLVVGDGEQRSIIEKSVLKKGWKNIKLLGFKDQSELPKYYDICDVFVLPSSFEPWGLVVNEAMNAGKAIIVSDHVGCGPDLVKSGVNGHVFEANNIDELHDALVDIVFSPEKTKSMGKASLDLINMWNYEEDLYGIKIALSKIH